MSDLRFLDKLEEELERVAHQNMRRGPRPRILKITVPAVAIVAIAVVVLSLTGGGNPGPSLLARAYAATSSAGQILFYKTTTYSPGEDKPDNYDARYRSTGSVWTSAHTVRTTEHLIIGGAPGHPSSPLSVETVISGDHYASWESTPNNPIGTITKTALPKRTCSIQDALVSTECGTPLEAVRKLYRSGALRLSGTTTFQGQKVDVLTERTPGPPMNHGDRASTLLTRVLVDASTFDPVSIQVSSGSYQSTTIFANFTRLALTSTNKQLLKMSPHPEAPVQNLPASGIMIKTRSSATSASSPTPKVLADIQLADQIHTPPYQHTAGVAELVSQNGQDGLAIVVKGLPRSTDGADYGVRIANASTHTNRLLGLIPGQPRAGNISAEIELPRSARRRYDFVELTIEPSHGPRSSTGKVVLRGKLP